MASLDQMAAIAAIDFKNQALTLKILCNLYSDDDSQLQALWKILFDPMTNKTNYKIQTKAKQNAAKIMNQGFCQKRYSLEEEEQLQFYWNILFSQNIDFSLKCLMEQSFIKLLHIWPENYFRLFMQGLQKVPVLIGRSYRLKQRVQELIPLKQHHDNIAVTIDHPQNIQNVFLSSLMMIRCFYASIRIEKGDKWVNFAKLIMILVKIIKELDKSLKNGFINQSIKKIIDQAFQYFAKMEIEYDQISNQKRRQMQMLMLILKAQFTNTFSIDSYELALAHLFVTWEANPNVQYQKLCWDIVFETVNKHIQDFDSQIIQRSLELIIESFIRTYNQGKKDKKNTDLLKKHLEVLKLIVQKAMPQILRLSQKQMVQMLKITYDSQILLNQMVQIAHTYVSQNKMYTLNHQTVLKFAISTIEKDTINQNSFKALIKTLKLMNGKEEYASVLVLANTIAQSILKGLQLENTAQTFEKIYLLLICLQKLIALFGSKISLTNLGEIFSKLMEFCKSDQTCYIKARIINLMICCHNHQIYSVNWPFIYQGCAKNCLWIQEKRLFLHNINEFVTNTEINRSPNDYAAIITILFQNFSNTKKVNSNIGDNLKQIVVMLKVFDLSNQIMQDKSKSICKYILKRKRFAIGFIMEQLDQTICRQVKKLLQELQKQEKLQENADTLPYLYF